jgi:hypothetical protein
LLSYTLIGARWWALVSATKNLSVDANTLKLHQRTVLQRSAVYLFASTLTVFVPFGEIIYQALFVVYMVFLVSLLLKFGLKVTNQIGQRMKEMSVGGAQARCVFFLRFHR